MHSMSNIETQYLNLLTRTVQHGVLKPNRTGVPALTLRGGAMLQADLREGLPIITSKTVALRPVKGELIGFLRGYNSAAQFRDLGCNIWNDNANHPGLPGSPNAWLGSPYRKGEDDLGRIYGVQWRGWRGHVAYDGSSENMPIDQLAEVIRKLVETPHDRRIIMSAWRPDEFDQMALPPCHVLYQFTVTDGYLDLAMYQRSCDMFLGVPFNMASCGILLCLVAMATGLRPGIFSHFLADVHVYENHVSQVFEQLERTPNRLPYDLVLRDYPSPEQLKTPGERLSWLTKINPGNIDIAGYNPHPPIKAPMAV